MEQGLILTHTMLFITGVAVGVLLANKLQEMKENESQNEGQRESETN